jgi:hypothetical protein
VSDLATDFMNWALTEKREKSRYEDQRMLDRIILPKLGRHRVSAIERRDVESLKASLAATHGQANRVLSLLSKMFSKAMDWQMRMNNPASKIKHYHEEKRDLWLSLEQLQALSTALDDYPDQNAADAVKGAEGSSGGRDFASDRGVQVDGCDRYTKTDPQAMSQDGVHFVGVHIKGPILGSDSPKGAWLTVTSHCPLSCPLSQDARR